MWGSVLETDCWFPHRWSSQGPQKARTQRLPKYETTEKKNGASPLVDCDRRKLHGRPGRRRQFTETCVSRQTAQADAGPDAATVVFHWSRARAATTVNGKGLQL